MLKAGIVGLPNVGKSTLFNAVTRSHKAAAENYPFCTIEPNLGVVSVPDELLEAARLDGAGEFTVFFRIVLPLSKPIIAVLVIFTFMWRWNDFAWPLVALTDQDMFTLPLGLNLLRGEVNPDWGNVMALALLSLLPMLLIFLAFQRYLVQGIASTGLK